MQGHARFDVALHDCQERRIGRPYTDAHITLLWGHKTCIYLARHGLESVIRLLELLLLLLGPLNAFVCKCKSLSHYHRSTV